MYEYRVKKLINVVDGDTIDVDIDLGFDISLSKRVRMAGIDTPESRTTDKIEKALGLEAKEYLKKNIKDAKDGYAWGYLGDTKVKDFEALAKQRKMSGK